MIALIDENFAQHANRIPSKTSDMEVYELDNLTYVDSGLSCDTFNIIHINNGRSLQEKELREAVDHFKGRNRDYCLWVNAENLLPGVEEIIRALKLERQNEEVGMILNLETYSPIIKEKHSNIKMASTVALLEDYAEVIARNWNPPDTNVLEYYQKTSQTYLEAREEIFFLTYYQVGKAVATVELFSTDLTTLGFYGFATLSDYRQKGIGSALFIYALNLAREKGFKNVILQATEDGIGIYKNYGFEAVTTYFEYA